MPILRAFNDFPDEASLIGRMLAGYADLEIDLMHCARAVRGDLDLALKVMFRARGNSQRIDIADTIARQSYSDLDLAAEFGTAINAMRLCLRIRNLYAHCTWWNDNLGQLAFANLEGLAKRNAVVTDLRTLTVITLLFLISRPNLITLNMLTKCLLECSKKGIAVLADRIIRDLLFHKLFQHLQSRYEIH